MLAVFCVPSPLPSRLLLHTFPLRAAGFAMLYSYIVFTPCMADLAGGICSGMNLVKAIALET